MSLCLFLAEKEGGFETSVCNPFVPLLVSSDRWCRNLCLGRLYKGKKQLPSVKPTGWVGGAREEPAEHFVQLLGI